jgi:hypothetical protein
VKETRKETFGSRSDNQISHSKFSGYRVYSMSSQGLHSTYKISNKFQRRASKLSLKGFGEDVVEPPAGLPQGEEGKGLGGT